MNKPNGYDEVNAGFGDFELVELGGHLAVIKSVKEQVSKTGKDMIVAAIDFDKADKQPGYFSDMFQNDTREEKKWPYNAIQYIVTTGNDNKCSKSFKSFITAFEDSNKCKVDWDADDFTKQFKGKKIGVVYGNVEEEYNGEVKMRRRIRWFCDVNKVANQKVPGDKLLAEVPAKPVNANTGFIDANAIDEEIPF